MPEFDGTQSLNPTYTHEGSVPFGNTVTVPTTALQDGDITLLYGPFPARSKFFNRAGEVVYETGTLDTDTTPALVLSLGFCDSGDSALDTPIATGIDEDDTGESAQVSSGGGWIDIEDKYLAAEITTSAATAASAAIEVGGFYHVNVKEQSETAS